MKKLLKGKKAITLIALVITIVVLVILAAVTISMTVGNDGLIAKAIKAANDYKNSQEKDKQGINDLYGELLVASDGTIQNLTLDKLDEIIDKKIEDNNKKLGLSSSKDTTPVGTVIAYMAASAPENYLVCDGSLKNKADYPELFNKLITINQSVRSTWGEADWETQFRVPNLQGEFLRGSGTNGHTNQGNGSPVGTHQDATTMPRLKGSSNGGVDSYGVSVNMENVDKWLGSTTRAQASTGSNWTPSVATQDRFAARPTNTSVLYCIKAK